MPYDAVILTAVLRNIFHRALSLLVASAVLLTSLPYVSFAHRHSEADAGHSHHHHGGTGHPHHHHGHSHHHHHHGGGTHAEANSDQLVHRHVYWWGFELTLPGSTDQEPNLNQFVTHSLPPSVVALVPDTSIKLIAQAATADNGLEALLAPTSAARIPTWQMPLPSRLSDTARRARSGVLLV